MSEFEYHHDESKAEQASEAIDSSQLSLPGKFDGMQGEIDQHIMPAVERIVELEPAHDYGEDYEKEVGHIEAGLSASRTYGEPKVQNDRGEWVPLARYIGGNGLGSKIGKGITLEGYNAIRLKYIGDSQQGPVENKKEQTLYHSGDHNYIDYQSAAAGDARDEDDS